MLWTGTDPAAAYQVGTDPAEAFRIGTLPAQEPDRTSAAPTAEPCPWCSGPKQWVYHDGPCPRVEAVEYYPWGTVERVELWPVVEVTEYRPEAWPGEGGGATDASVPVKRWAVLYTEFAVGSPPSIPVGSPSSISEVIE